MLKRFLMICASLGTAVSIASAQQGPKIDPDRVEEVVRKAFVLAPPEWAGRLDQDETMRICSQTNNAPSKEQAEHIVERAKSTIQYPLDGKLIGDWKKGESLAQSGYGMRFSDYPPRRETGGNCYACHQISKAEVSYGTIGPSLAEYGKTHKFSEASIKAAYDKIYNAHSQFPCSLMPRFGANNVLSIEQITHLTAYLMSPDSPVNK